MLFSTQSEISRVNHPHLLQLIAGSTRRCFITIFIRFILLFISSPAIALTFSGQLSLRGNGAWVDSDSILSRGTDETLLDGAGNLRLMTHWENRTSAFTLHYDLSAIGGEFFQRMFETDSLLPNVTGSGSSDASKVLNLSRTLSESSQSRFQHHIDRFSYQYFADWGTLTVGRDVVTWGNGLVFNPLDLLNPFSPQDIERDYKVGDDMLLIDLFPLKWNGDLAWQILAVPHRNPLTGDLDIETSSVAIKTHFFTGNSEWDLLTAMHYDELHLGAGSVHTVGGAVVRADLLIGIPNKGETRYSAILNIDYSWTTVGLNTYGMLEYYYQSVGSRNFQNVTSNIALQERLARGEVYTSGQQYLAAALQMELHPLLHAHCSFILNLQDQSLLLQPYLLWDPKQNLQVALGIQYFTGSQNTEFGSSEIPFSSEEWQTPNSLFIWMKWYF